MRTSNLEHLPYADNRYYGDPCLRGYFEIILQCNPDYPSRERLVQALFVFDTPLIERDGVLVQFPLENCLR